VVELPVQIVVFGPALTVGTGFTVMVTESLAVQPSVVPVTTYFVVVVGDTVRVTVSMPSFHK
jgi:hypothetical protein